MTRTRMLWIAVLVAMTVIAGCGGKKAADNPPPIEPANGGATETVQEDIPPATSDPVVNTAIDMSMVSDVFFEFDSYALSSEAKSTLEANARELKAKQGNITIEGHCDERGTQAYNLALGEKRANAAKEFLVALGVEGGRINTVSYGKERPFETGHDESAWAKNRRAHFVGGQ